VKKIKMKNNPRIPYGIRREAWAGTFQTNYFKGNLILRLN
jgi:hypothetical protein